MLTTLARSAAPRLVLVACASVLLGWTVPSSAAAEIVSGRCTGTVTIDDSITLDADQPRDVPVEVPTSGSFVFVGGIERDGGEEAPVPYSGELRLLLPIGSWQLEEWSGETTETEVVASGGYALPGILAGGTGPVPFEVVHIAGGDVCRIVVSVTTPGSAWDAVTIGLLVVTLLLVAATFAAGRRDARGRGRPLVGFVAGSLGGLTGAATLFGAAGIALDSAVWWVLPAVLAALGLLLGVTAPFGAEATAADAADAADAAADTPDIARAPDAVAADAADTADPGSGGEPPTGRSSPRFPPD
jgi:hypothetical protein